MRPVIDHVPFAVTDLESATDRFERVGLPPRYGGPHGDGTTEMALLALPDGSYLELIAPTGEGEPGFWPNALESGVGPCAWAVQTESVHTELQRFITHDVRVDGPIRTSRSRPDGTHVEWDMGFLGSGESEALPFLIADRTPREYRVPDSELYGSPLSGIGWVVIGVLDIEAAIDRFTRLYRLPEPKLDVDSHFGEMAWFPDQAFVLAEPSEDPLLERLNTLGPGPMAVFLSGDLTRSRSEYPLTDSRSLFDRSLSYFEGFDRQLGVLERR